VFIAGAAIPFRSSFLAPALAVIAGYAAWKFALAASSQPVDTDLLALGYQNTQRAQVFPFLLVAFVLLLLSRQSLLEPIARHSWQQWPLIVPVGLVFAMHLVELREWRNFEALFCAEVTQPNDQNRDAAFFAQREVRRFGWNWEFPSLSVLFRNSDSDHIVSLSSYQGWQPFDPAGVAPDIIRSASHNAELSPVCGS